MERLREMGAGTGGEVPKEPALWAGPVALESSDGSLGDPGGSFLQPGETWAAGHGKPEDGSGALETRGQGGMALS